ncbi:helicase-like transcription factor [Pyrenophora seminiperda CCB06]|uniref:Helicase-like transcription factor n=1 Tax=Pyrenophora seminiperda CCB06 TaxID=1302712 RepID=A0A3M7MC34_9PLEO|nr:helicase-like transcription factor [Pyrenophora seminiperda CCB06]
MQSSELDTGRTESAASETTSHSSLVVDDSAGSQICTPVSTSRESSPSHSSPQVPLTLCLPELTAHVPGDTVTPSTHNHNHNQATPAPQPPQFDPRSLLNPRSSNAKRPASSGGEGDHGRTDPTIAGQVSLVERLHNVTDRTATPVKRVKTDEPRKSKSNRSNFGSEGALDFQDQTGTSATPQPQQGPAIDLTMSDEEDDVQVIRDNSNDDVSIGKVKQTYIQAHQVPFPDPKKYSGNHGGQSRIKVTFRRGGGNKGNQIIMVLDGMGKEFGKVDMKTAQGLTPLIDSANASGLKWIAWTEPRRKIPNEGGPGTQISALISMTLQLYCPRKNADNIGRFLKSRNLILENPVFELARHDYYNPQTKQSFLKAQVGQPDFQPSTQYAVGAPGSNYVIRSADEIRAEMDDVFDKVMTTSKEVAMREPSPLITTELYPHQKQALHFMIEHEQATAGEDGEDPLWKPHFRNNGHKYYIHRITGEEVAGQPKRTLGGILADEMGLGKTLSILSLICDNASIAAGQEFCRMKPPSRPLSTMIQPIINSRATLLVCPLSTMTNWKEQIMEHFPIDKSTLKWIRYHGSERFMIPAEKLADHDIVLTTYHIIAKDLLDKKRPLPYINWFRIVLDEAHTIRNPTNQSKVACLMMGQRRWAVTGTPVQNRLEDLGALFNFIKLSPFDTPSGFNQFILTPFKNADPMVVDRLQLLVGAVTIRRTKEIIKGEIPKKTDYVVRLQFSKEEQQLHDWFEKDTQRKVLAVTQGNKIGGQSYARILSAILNLRLICAHGRDLLSEEALKTTDGMTYEQPMELEEDDHDTPQLTRQQAYDMLSLLQSTSADECHYCDGKKSLLEPDSAEEDEEGNVPDVVGYMTTCYNLVCPRHVKTLRDKWKKAVQADGLARCPICDDVNRPAALELSRADFYSYLEEQDRIRKDPKLAKKIGSYTGPHTKTRALLKDLEDFRLWSDQHPEERPIKSIVFSSWTTHLDLIEIALKTAGHTLVRLDGRMTRENRDKSMAALREDPSIRVMLVSIGAGGLGLNLTTANKVFMMEPQFNPAAEAQAVDRVHRLGQDREVTIKRFIMEGSFEEKMLVLQEKKKALADLTMSRERKSKEESTRARMEQLRSLFR